MSTTGTLCRQIRSGPKRQQGLTVSELQALRVGFVPGGDALLMLDDPPLMPALMALSKPWSNKTVA